MKKRALSTIVGSVFFVIVMSSTISYVGYSMDLIGNLAESVEVKQDQNLNRQNEELIISDFSIDNNEFNLTVTNTGDIPINITRMWAQNTTDSTWNQTKYQLNQLVFPGQSVSDIGIGTGLFALDSQSYNLKLTTERGNSINTPVVTASSQALEMRLYTTPSSPLSNQTVNLLYTVKNNLTEGSIIQSLSPIMDVSGTGTGTIQGTVTPASVEGLGPGEIAFFEWTSKVEGDENDTVVFNATVANAVPGNNVTDTTTIIVAPVATETVVAGVAGAVGFIHMEFESFEACEPSADDCRSNSSDWFQASEVEANTEYLWRVDLHNNGEYDLIFEEHTALLFIPAHSGGGSGTMRPYFIRADSTTSTEDGGLYTDESKIIDSKRTEKLYFATKIVGDPEIEKTHSAESIVAVNVLIFAYQDINDNGTVQPSDTPYSQNLPFQSYKLLPPP